MVCIKGVTIVAMPLVIILLARGVNYFLVFGVAFIVYGGAVAILYSSRRARLNKVKDKYGLVSGQQYNVFLTNGKEHRNVRFYAVYDWQNQSTVDTIKVEGKVKVVKANIGIKFLDGDKEIRIKVIHIREISIVAE